MGHFIFHSIDLKDHLEPYADKLGQSPQVIREVYDRLLERDVLTERPSGAVGSVKTYISYIDQEKKLTDPIERAFYVALKREVPATLMPGKLGLNWPTLVNRLHRWWEQIYNIIICKIPSHWVRILWLRAGGMKIGKGSTVWRNTEVLGIENIVIGNDSVVGWHCQLDGRAGLIIGDHVTIASYVLIIAGSHEFTAQDFGIIGETIYIEDYVWIASRAMLTHGARIGKGAIVGAGTNVSKLIKPYKIVFGQNAKPVGDRPHDLHYLVKGRGLFTLLH
ncbi:MAG: acyltransferase [Candidatus Competibacteraceae bacterium]|nr:acyltransferase [Candidatus Competibacteraceae bacterium]